MDFSSLTGLDMAVLVSVAVAIIIIILLLCTIGKKISEDTRRNKDSTFRIVAKRNGAVLTLEPIEYNSDFGKVSFVVGANEADIKENKADIIFNNVIGIEYGNGSGTGGSMGLKVFNRTKDDIYITRITSSPTHQPGGITISANTPISTVFDPVQIRKGATAEFSFYSLLSEDKSGKMAIDIDVSHDMPTVISL